MIAGTENYGPTQHKEQREPSRFATVLVVDDDLSILDALQDGLQISGVSLRVRTTDSAMTALELIPQIEPDVVLLDLQMPQMNGFEFLEQLRDLPQSPRVIMLTAQDYPQNLFKSIDFEVPVFVAKPFDLSELEAAIRHQLQESWDGAGPHPRVPPKMSRKSRNQRRVAESARYAGITPFSIVSFECECSLDRCAERILLHINEYQRLTTSPENYIAHLDHTHSLAGNVVLKFYQFAVVEDS